MGTSAKQVPTKTSECMILIALWSSLHCGHPCTVVILALWSSLHCVHPYMKFIFALWTSLHGAQQLIGVSLAL